MDSNTENFGSLNAEEVQFVLRLLSEARAAGIAEIRYKGLWLRLGAQAQQTGSGPVAQGRTPHMNWSPELPKFPGV